MKGDVMSNYLKLMLCVAVLVLLAVLASSQDDNAISGVGGYLDTGDNSARQDIKAAFGEESLFNPGKSSSIIGTGKKVPVSVTRDMLPTDENASGAASAPASVAGRWSLAFTDGTAGSASLMLAQSNDALFGRGYMVYGNATQEVTATGSVSGNEISLDVLALNDMFLYRMDLALENNLLSGEYTAYSVSIAPWSGAVKGNIA
jgi:hypothetical protein